MHEIEKNLREAGNEWTGVGNTKNWKITDIGALMLQAASHIAGQVIENTHLQQRLDAKKECVCL